MSDIPLVLVDAFCRGPFSGNPASVVILTNEPSATWMQAVAAEMAQAETAFVWPMLHDWGLRWFTPTTEVALCGHATLAAAHALKELGRVTGSMLTFHSKSGPLRVECATNNNELTLDFPQVPMVRTSPPDALIPALGVQPLNIWQAGPDIVVLVAQAEEVEQLQPDLAMLATIPVRGVGVTAHGGGDGDYDVVSRFFAPASGIPEDAVTGSLHCALGPYFMKALRRTSLRCRQASARGGELTLHLRDERVLLSGRARMVMRGEWIGDVPH
jgi:PhzF family phenazine biosynthesis protein